MIHVISAEYYLIAPFRINDWSSFSTNLPNIWKPFHSYNERSIKEHVANYLGYIESSYNSLLSSGIAYEGNLQSSNDKNLTSWKGTITLCTADGEEHPKAKQLLSPDNIVAMHIAPNRKSGLAMIKLKSSGGSLADVVTTNYYLHKTDSAQNPYMKLKTGYDKENKQPVFSVRGVLLDIFKKMLPNGSYEWENPARFVTASYVQIDTSSNKDIKEIQKQLALLGQAKDGTYLLSARTIDDSVELYQNIWTYASAEGFACIVLNDTPGNEPQFIRDSSSTFEKSYLPLFLTNVIADTVYSNALRNLDLVASDINEQNKIRETRLVIALSASHYEHLNRLLSCCRAGRNLEEKYSSIVECIEARRMQLERERLEIEKTQQDAEQSRRKQEEDRDRSINYILGFIGIGQVIFAILQMTGVNSIFGKSFADGILGKAFVWFWSGLFLVSIGIYLYRLVKRK